ncbi:phenylalanine--tRNA ligase subunit alpha [Candidatus Woesearchaeota archaeon]|nr:phenylalanine--tRNA ligase subunit alpha [Candidatus Woesearchaeota archaeon]
MGKASLLKDIARQAGMQEVEAMRALQWLQNKKLVELKESVSDVVELDENGILYLEKGIPERKFLQALKEKSTLPQIAERSGLSNEEISVCLGILRSKTAIDIAKKEQVTVSITANGKALLSKDFPEEKFIRKKFPLEMETLKDEDRLAFDNLLKRKRIIRVDKVKAFHAALTDLGKKIGKLTLSQDLAEKLTSSMLKDGSWKGKKFRRYDVKVNVPSIFGGRKQHYRAFLDEVRAKFLSLGFKEMFGPAVETDFWDMDALFMPQFHSARDIHQGYYVKEPRYSKDLPKDKVTNVKNAHENGFGTGSRGWQYNFDVQRTHRHMLRTHDTSISARTLASKELEIPGKYFQMARCFRYDVIDATHLPDFNQVGGFVIEEGINFRHLKGLLKMFAEEFADTETIRIKPSYFPFTEPSAELQAKHPEMGWIELAGSGIFRPELVKPLVGKEVPVIAWGVGLDRLAMFKLGINDIRQLFSHDMEFLRNAKAII